MEPSEGVMEIKSLEKENKPVDIRAEVVENIHSGKDGEGATLSLALQDAIKNPDVQSNGAIHVIAVEYNKAGWSYKNLNEPGESNKLLASLKALNEQIGKTYDPTIEVLPDVPENERAQKLTLSLKRDYEAFLSDAVDFHLGGYVDAKVEVENERAKLTDVISKDPANISRAEVRIAAYKLNRSEMGVNNVSDKLLTRTGLEDEYQMDLLEQRVGRNILPLGERAEGPKISLDAPERFSDQINFYTESLGAINGMIRDKQNELKEVVTNTHNPESICLITNELKALVTDSKYAESRLKVSQAGQNKEEAWNNFTNSGAKLADSFENRKISTPEAAKNFVGAYVNAVKAEGSLLKERLRSGFSSLGNKLESFAGSARENAARVHVAFSESYESVVKDNLHKLTEKRKSDREETKGKYENLKSTYQRGIIDTRRAFYDEVHSLSINKDKKVMELALKTEKLKRKVGIKTAEIVGKVFYSDEKKQKLERRKERLEGAVERLMEMKDREITERPNPHYEFFTDQLDQYVVEAAPPIDLIEEQARVFLKEHEFDSLDEIQNLMTPDRNTVFELRKAIGGGSEKPDPQIQLSLDEAEEELAVKERAYQIQFDKEWERTKVMESNARSLTENQSLEEIKLGQTKAVNYLAKMRLIVESDRSEANLRQLKIAERDFYSYQRAVGLLATSEETQETPSVRVVDKVEDPKVLELHNTALENAIRRYLKSKDKEDLSQALRETQRITGDLKDEDDAYLSGVRGMERIAGDLLKSKDPMPENIARANLTQLTYYQQERYKNPSGQIKIAA